MPLRLIRSQMCKGTHMFLPDWQDIYEVFFFYGINYILRRPLAFRPKPFPTIGNHQFLNRLHAHTQTIIGISNNSLHIQTQQFRVCRQIDKDIGVNEVAHYRKRVASLTTTLPFSLIAASHVLLMACFSTLGFFCFFTCSAIRVIVSFWLPLHFFASI